MTTEELIEYLKEHPGKQVFTWVEGLNGYAEVEPRIFSLVAKRFDSSVYSINRIRDSKSAIEAVVL